MPALRYVLADVFTDRPLAGNGLAVFTDAREIPEEQLQPLARELNLSETVFVLPSEGDGHARVRIFTPAQELPFAGHPILGTAFMGLSILASHIDPVVSEEETLLSTMARYVYGGETPLYYILQFATFAILILAANTAFADFPRVSSIIAGDGFLPRQFANRGDRLVFSNGILVLAAVAGLLIVAFGGETSASPYALMWQWSGGGGAVNGIGGFNGDLDTIDTVRLP